MTTASPLSHLYTRTKVASELNRSQLESDTHIVSDNQLDKQPSPDPLEDFADSEPDPDEELEPVETPVAVIEPVVLATPAGSSIVAGQQLIKTRTPSPSPLPE